MIKPVFYITILLSLFVSRIQAQQNLVPNGSFEEYHCCPQQTGDFHCVKKWFSPTSTTPDYYNICATSSDVKVPINIYGQQSAQSGVGYVGIVLNTEDEFREYVAVELDEYLFSGRIYQYQFFVSTSDLSYNPSNNMGVLFITDLSSLEFDTTTISGTPIILNSNSNDYQSIVSDTIGWTKISGEYTATGCEKFLIIGNFKSQAETNFTYPGTLIESYYYIDNVSMIPVNSLEGTLPNILTPNNDGVNDYYYFETNVITSIQIMNRWGEVVYFSRDEINWNGEYKGEPCSEGVYFYQYEFKNCNNTIEYKTGFIQLIR